MFLYFKIGNKGGECVPETTTNGQKAPPSKVDNKRSHTPEGQLMGMTSEASRAGEAPPSCVWCEQATPRRQSIVRRETQEEEEEEAVGGFLLH